MRYCGVVSMQDALQLSMLEEVRAPDPPIRLSAMFFEPGSARQVATELRALGNVVVAVGAPLGQPRAGRQPGSPETERLAELLADLPRFRPSEEIQDGSVGDGAYGEFPLFETNADGVFFALQGRRLPAKRHPLGLQLRVDELSGDHVIDEGGDLWHRRIEELDEAVVVLPGSSVPDAFTSEGVMPPVERLRLPTIAE
jgi:hypothetical protein